MALKGMEEVLDSLNRELAKVENLSVRGLYKAGLQVQSLSQSRTPVRFGFLKGSAFTRKEGGLRVSVGYTAAYALHVHENLEARHTNGQSKFLESALRDTDVLDIVAKEASI